MKTNRVILLLFVSICCFLLGCQKKGSVDDFTTVRLQRFINSPQHPDEAKQLAEQAILLWENDKLDNKPLLIEAVLSCASKDKNQKYLGIAYYDEDKDLAGIIVEEHSRAKAKDDILVEKYPAYNDKSSQLVFDIIATDITQRKDGLLKTDILQEKSTISNFSGPLQSPPVVVSLPSEQIDVYITLYDRQGNQSNKVKLIDVTSYSGKSKRSEKQR